MVGNRCPRLYSVRPTGGHDRTKSPAKESRRGIPRGNPILFSFSLANYWKLIPSCTKTSILQENDARESLVWETLRWIFAPVAVSSFEGAPWPVGSVAGAQKRPTLDTLRR